MTKLNITNKTIYKLKKIKTNQRKMFLKKEKYKKRKNRGMVGVLEKEEENIISKIILLKNIKNKKGGAGEIDTRTKKSKDDGKKIQKFVAQQNQKEEEIKSKKEELDKIRERQIKNKDTQGFVHKGIALVGKLDEDEKKLKNLNQYKEHVKMKLKDERKKVKKFKKNLKITKKG